MSWKDWSEEQFDLARSIGRILINPIIYAELAPAFTSRKSLDAWFDPGVFRWLPLPYSAGWRASEAYAQYKRVGGQRLSPLPDFYIGAHAEVEGLTLVTRDVSRYRTYFPSVSLITP